MVVLKLHRLETLELFLSIESMKLENPYVIEFELYSNVKYDLVKF